MKAWRQGLAAGAHASSAAPERTLTPTSTPLKSSGTERGQCEYT